MKKEVTSHNCEDKIETFIYSLQRNAIPYKELSALYELSQSWD